MWQRQIQTKKQMDYRGTNWNWKFSNLRGKIIAQFDFRKGGREFTCENMIADLFAYLLIGSLFNSPMICVKLLIGHHLRGLSPSDLFANSHW